VWSADHEEGTVTEVTSDIIAVRWDHSGYYVYARCSFAARENIIVLADRPSELSPI
jgi:hypothetical protein